MQGEEKDDFVNGDGYISDESSFYGMGSALEPLNEP